MFLMPILKSLGNSFPLNLLILMIKTMSKQHNNQAFEIHITQTKESGDILRFHKPESSNIQTHDRDNSCLLTILNILMSYLSNEVSKICSQIRR